MSNLAAFLEARIAETEASIPTMIGYGSEHLIAECKSKRWILGSLASTAKAHSHETHVGQKLVLAGMDTGLRLAIKALVQPYRGHPDFDEDWAL